MLGLLFAADVLAGKVTSILSFDDLAKDHSGTYTCRDKNFNKNAMDVTVDYIRDDELPTANGNVRRSKIF